MKNRTKLFNIIMFAIIIELGITACYNTSFENKELKTNGRLTITGLNDYEGQEISVYSNYTDDSTLYACGHIEEQFFDGKLVDNYILNGSIINGQANLIVYHIKNFKEKKDYDDRYEGKAEDYNGNDKEVYFDVYKRNKYSSDHIGYVIVNFTHGKGSGVFKEGGLYYDRDYVNLGNITGATIIDRTVNYVNANSRYCTLRLGSDVDLAANTNRILKDGTLTITGLDTERKIKLTSAGSIFTVEKGSLTLGDNITLVGYNGNNSPVVTVTGRAHFEMYGNSKITGNTNYANGGGVFIDKSCVFDMYDNASISGNTSYANGGGVYVNGGTFKMCRGGGTVYGSNEPSSLANTALRGAALGIALDSSAQYATSINDRYSYSNILPHTDGQQLYTNNTIVGK